MKVFQSISMEGSSVNTQDILFKYVEASDLTVGSLSLINRSSNETIISNEIQKQKFSYSLVHGMMECEDKLMLSYLLALIAHLKFDSGRDKSGFSLRIDSNVNRIKPSILENLGFVRIDENSFELCKDKGHCEDIYRTKSTLFTLIETSPLVGSGYVVDIQGLEEHDIQNVIDEYNEIAWGKVNWATNSEIQRDEIDIINQYVCGGVVAEIGAGSGRMSSTIAARANTLVSTDYISEVADNLKINLSSLKNVKVVQDNILSTQLEPRSFDLVCFFENGLGEFINKGKRLQAVEQMKKLCKSDGHILLGLRTLGEQSGAHLMPATMDAIFMGLFHTFSEEEIYEFEKIGIELVLVRNGDGRPAGGNQIFCLYQMKKEP